MGVDAVSIAITLGRGTSLFVYMRLVLVIFSGSIFAARGFGRVGSGTDVNLQFQFLERTSFTIQAAYETRIRTSTGTETCTRIKKGCRD